MGQMWGLKVKCHYFTGNENDKIVFRAYPSAVSDFGTAWAAWSRAKGMGQKASGNRALCHWDLGIYGGRWGQGRGHRGQLPPLAPLMCISSSKADRFTSNQFQNDQQPTVQLSLNAFHQRKCFVLWYLSDCPEDHMSQPPPGRAPTCYNIGYSGVKWIRFSNLLVS